MFSSLKIGNPFATAPALSARQKTIQKVRDVADAADKYMKATKHFGATSINSDRNLAPQYAGLFDQALTRLNSPSTVSLKDLEFQTEYDPVKTGQFVIAPIGTLPSLLEGQAKIEKAQEKIARMLGVVAPSAKRKADALATSEVATLQSRRRQSLSDTDKAIKLSLGLSPHASPTELAQAQKSQAELDTVLKRSETDVGGINRPRHVGNSAASSSRSNYRPS